MAQQLIDSLGLVGLFVAALLAASVLVFPMEALVPVMVTQGYSSVGIVIAGTLGGYVGSLVNYHLAARGEEWWRERHPRHHGRLDRATAAFARWGSPTLLLSWLPVIGELLTLVAGLAGVRLRVFSFFTIIGRAVRMIALIQLSVWIF